MTTPLIIPERILRFLNALPVTGEPLEWITVFRDELCLLLGDVDRVAVNVNLGCDLKDPQSYQPAIHIRHFTTDDSEDGELRVEHSVRENTQAERLIESIKDRGFPVDQYLSPSVFNYYLGGSAYLGTIFLWRQQGHSPISDDTLQVMMALQPFFVFALSDLVARRQQIEPADKTFLEAFRSLSVAAGLSKQEQRVIVLQLFGHSYKEIADILDVSMDGVKHHLKMIHRKTGSRSYTELFAKYFMPRLELRENLEGENEPSVQEIIASEAVIIKVDVPIALNLSHENLFFASKTSIGDRLRKFGEIAFGSIEDFARALKVAPSNLQKYLNGERNPGLGMLQRLYELGCNINALIGQEGSMIADNEPGRVIWDRLGLVADSQAGDPRGVSR